MCTRSARVLLRVSFSFLSLSLSLFTIFLSHQKRKTFLNHEEETNERERDKSVADECRKKCVKLPRNKPLEARKGKRQTDRESVFWKS